MIVDKAQYLVEVNIAHIGGYCFGFVSSCDSGYMGQYAERLSHRFDLPEIIRQWHELLSGIAAGPRKKMT